jgi:hypothetical protein
MVNEAAQAMEVLNFCCGHQHVLATHVAIFRMVKSGQNVLVTTIQENYTKMQLLVF